MTITKSGRKLSRNPTSAFSGTPDHDPNGNCLERRAVQLGLRGETLRRFGQSELISIEDITSFVIEQRENLKEGFQGLHTPCEEIYRPHSTTAAQAVGIDL